jgi:hypothetical protein
LDRGLPSRLTQLSDRPEGSLTFPAKPDQDLVGTIGGDGGVDIVVERVDRKGSGSLPVRSGEVRSLRPAQARGLLTLASKNAKITPTAIALKTIGVA